MAARLGLVYGHLSLSLSLRLLSNLNHQRGDVDGESVITRQEPRARSGGRETYSSFFFFFYCCYLSSYILFCPSPWPHRYARRLEKNLFFLHATYGLRSFRARGWWTWFRRGDVIGCLTFFLASCDMIGCWLFSWWRDVSTRLIGWLTWWVQLIDGYCSNINPCHCVILLVSKRRLSVQRSVIAHPLTQKESQNFQQIGNITEIFRWQFCH